MSPSLPVVAQPGSKSTTNERISADISPVRERTLHEPALFFVMTCLLSSLITDRFTCTRRRLICVWRQTVNCLAGPRHVVRVLNWMILRLRPSSDSCLVETVLGIGPPARNLSGSDHQCVDGRSAARSKSRTRAALLLPRWITAGSE